MDGLIIVHVGMEFIDHSRYQNNLTEARIRLIERIAEEARKYINQRDKVYFLPMVTDGPEAVPPAIRDYYERMTCIPKPATYSQYLRTKEQIIKDRIDQVTVTGTCHALCVRDMYYLLRGKYYRRASNTEKPEYEKFREKLGWSRRKFNRIYSAIVNATINEDLTDKCLH